jgi:ABC-type branched-subunit amino acid transport system ATPase component
VLSQGSTLTSGSPAEVRSNPAVLEAYLGADDEDTTSTSPTSAAPTDVSTTSAQTTTSAPTTAVSASVVSEPSPEHASAAASRAAAPAAPDVLLQLDAVCAGYGGDDILKQVTLSVPRGEITCVVGPNGAGKSTVMKAISGLLRPRQGEIRYEGEVISGLPPKQVLAKGIAQVPQAHSLFPDMTVQENVEMGAYSIRDKAIMRERLAAVQELYPIVRDRADHKAGSLSGGQQRLVEFARCLMLDPKLIMLDEPSMGLDPHTRTLVFAMVGEMNRQGRTILLVEQNARAGLKLSSNGVVLENGRVRLTGSGHDVLTHPEIGALYLGGAVAAS